MNRTLHTALSCAARARAPSLGLAASPAANRDGRRHRAQRSDAVEVAREYVDHSFLPQLVLGPERIERCDREQDRWPDDLWTVDVLHGENPSGGDAQRRGCREDRAAGYRASPTRQLTPARARARATRCRPCFRRAQRLGELRHGWKPIGRRFGHGTVDGVLDHLRHGIPHDGDRRHRLEHVPRHEGLRGLRRERRLSSEQLVQHAGETVLIAATVEVAIRCRLLGTHVGRGAETHAGAGERLRCAQIGARARNAEVGEQRYAVLQQDVLRLHVTMDDPVPVRILQSIRDRSGDAHGVGNRELRLALEPRMQRFTGHHRHHEVELPVRLP